MSARHVGRRYAAKALGFAALGSTPAIASPPASPGAPVDPVVTLWATLQAVNAELERVSDQQAALREVLIQRRPGQPLGMAWRDWHRDDPDLAQCMALHDRSNQLLGISSDLYDDIATAVATTPAGIRAKAAAALSIWAQETALHEECGFAELILNALREAAAGSAA